MKATTDKATEYLSETTNTVLIVGVFAWRALPLKNVVAGGVFNVLFIVHLGHMLDEVSHLKILLCVEHHRKNELCSIAFFLEQGMIVRIFVERPPMLGGQETPKPPVHDPDATGCC